MSNSNITHTGIVVGRRGSQLHVKLEHDAEQDCSGCRIASVCRGREADLVVDGVTGNYTPGERVRLTASGDIRSKAAILTLGAPLAIFMAVLLALSLTGCPGWAACTAAFAALALYFLWLRGYSRHLSRRSLWRVEKI